jgi:hypothetical protein
MEMSPPERVSAPALPAARYKPQKYPSELLNFNNVAVHHSTRNPIMLRYIIRIGKKLGVKKQKNN